MKKYILLFVAIAALVMPFLACGSTAGSSNTGSAVTPSDNSNSTPTAPAQHFKVGAVVKVGDTWQVTVNGAKTSKGGEFDSLKGGEIFLEIDVTLKNISPQEQNTSSFVDWTLKDSGGQKYPLSYASDAPASPDGKVAAHDQLRGTLVYTVPKTMKQFTLAFAPDLLSAGQTIWDVTVK